MDREELEPVNFQVYKEKETRFYYNDKFVVIFPNQMIRLMRGMPPSQHYVLLQLLRMITDGNHVTTSIKQIHNELKKANIVIKRNHISTAIKRLLVRGFFEIVSKGKDHLHLEFHEEFVWRGTAAAHAEKRKSRLAKIRAAIEAEQKQEPPDN